MNSLLCFSNRLYLRSLHEYLLNVTGLLKDFILINPRSQNQEKLRGLCVSMLVKTRKTELLLFVLKLYCTQGKKKKTGRG